MEKRNALNRSTACSLCITVSWLTMGCATAREYRLPSPDPVPQERVQGAVLIDGEAIEFDPPGAIWLETDGLAGRVNGELAVVALDSLASERIDARSTSASRSSGRSWIAATAAFFGTLVLFGLWACKMDSDSWC